VLSLKHRNSFKPSCFDCFICSKYYTGIFLPESSGSFYIRLFSHIYIASFAPASSVVQSRQLMLPLSAALASREVLQLLIQQRLKRALEGRDAGLDTHFKSYIKYIYGGSKQESEDYWRSTLAGRSYSIYPNVPREVQPQAKEWVVHHMDTATNYGASDFTIPLVIRAAWAIVAARMSNSEEVLFGETLAGRDSPVTGIETIEGPIFAVIPIRQRVEGALSITSFLKLGQQRKLEMMPHEHIGSRTRRLGDDAFAASMYSTMLATHPQIISDADKVVLNGLSSDNPFAIVLTNWLTRDGVTFKANINPGLVEIGTMKQLLRQLEFVMRKLVQNPEMLVRDLHVELHHV
jgi:fusarinine C synthase